MQGSAQVGKLAAMHFPEGHVHSLLLNCCRESKLKPNKESLAAAEPDQGAHSTSRPARVTLGPLGKNPPQLGGSQAPLSLLMQMHPLDTQKGC